MTISTNEAYERHVTELYPYINWREPIHITVPGVGEAWACRLCIGMHGLRGEGVLTHPQTIEQFQIHLLEDHYRRDL